MKIYIQATAAISPQKTFGEVPFLTELIEYNGNRLQTIEPEYKSFIDAKSLRRMSRIIKMGVAAASACLQEANEKNPGAIITGTTYGCLEDTGVFLTEVIQRNEELPPPTAFIQSTHNTVGAQVALLLKCHNYNNTFVHNGFSFESALLDALLLLKENETDNVLVGSVDELTDHSFTVLNRLGLYKRTAVSNMDLYSLKSKGTIAGEGAAFFFLTNIYADDAYAVLEGMATFYQPADIKEVEHQIVSFLSAHHSNLQDIDLVITGKNGDVKEDEIYEQLQKSIFANNQLIQYKHLCGEYPTAISFALWMAASILRTGAIPVVTGYQVAKEGAPKMILIYNHYQHKYHSLLLVSAVE
jgi:3-oxoacyl-[acyl-carrier-protein] synthase II